MINEMMCNTCHTTIDTEPDGMDLCFRKGNAYYFYRSCVECGTIHEVELVSLEDEPEVLSECDCGAEKHGFIGHITGCPKY
jgi:hypothetical protein